MNQAKEIGKSKTLLEGQILVGEKQLKKEQLAAESKIT